ncbi:hypothetical protein [Nocardioides zeicaulis]|uniref:Uncharacterized protein n=1 Tax=Nocardioides zeicaulis TaxID=1776857 RepID=A0ABV6E6X7_9ACTN
MDNQVQLISDGDGLAIIGEPAAVELFLQAEDLPSRELGLPQLRRVLTHGSAGLQAGSEIASSSGRWVKLTEESAQKIKKYGLMESKIPGVSHAMAGKPGDIKGWLQITTRPGALATNPAVLAGAAGLMAQLAMQQTMGEITDYLARIDGKLDDLIRAQKDAVVAPLIGVGFQIDEAMQLRAHVGAVNEVTWSKVQSSSGTIAEVQAYTLLQLDGLAERLEGRSKLGHLVTASEDAESRTRHWLAILARTIQLQDAIAVLELDRVLATTPGDLDGHRLGLKAARNERLETISRTTDGLVSRIDTAAGFANTKVLLHPSRSPEVVRAGLHVLDVVVDFEQRLGMESNRERLEAKRWADAATDLRDKALVSGSRRVDAARALGSETYERAILSRSRLSNRVAERARRMRRGTDDK